MRGNAWYKHCSLATLGNPDLLQWNQITVSWKNIIPPEGSEEEQNAHKVRKHIYTEYTTLVPFYTPAKSATIHHIMLYSTNPGSFSLERFKQGNRIQKCIA